MSGLPEALETAREAGEVLSAAVLSQENAEGLDGSGLDFRDCRFQSCRLRNCDFTGAAFYGCTFTGCLLENCRLSATYWKDCRLSGCKWDGADLRRSRWKDSVLEETLLRYVNFSGGVWERISVKECDFTESTLSEMRLKKAAMEKTDLTGAELFRTSLAGMDLTACTLDRIVLSETCRELKGAVINAAQAAVVARILGICPAAGMADPRAMDRISHPRSHTKHQGPPKTAGPGVQIAFCWPITSRHQANSRSVRAVRSSRHSPAFRAWAVCRISRSCPVRCCSRSDLRRQ